MRHWDSDKTSTIIDGLLKFIAGGGVVTAALLAPNAVQIFEKPLIKMLNNLDKREQERELRRIVAHMRYRGLIKFDPRHYEHGMQITTAGRKRLERVNFASIKISTPKKWDKKWRLVLFDVPVNKNSSRHAFTNKLRSLEFQQLQRSVWVHPFPCRAELESITEALKVRKYVTYLEISAIDSENKLRERFKLILNKAR